MTNRKKVNKNEKGPTIEPIELINFIDFRKAFDSVHRESLWKILALYGIPDKYINIFKNIYRGSQCKIRTDADSTDTLEIVTGVRQGCLLLPLLFIIAVDFIMGKTKVKHRSGLNGKVTGCFLI